MDTIIRSTDPPSVDAFVITLVDWCTTTAQGRATLKLDSGQTTGTYERNVEKVMEQKVIDYASIAKKKLRPINESELHIIGVGGTGGYVVRDIARLLYSLNLKGQNHKMILWDHDIVEERNLLRQNFIEPDIGLNKAEVLAERYSGAFGIDITAMATLFTAETFKEKANKDGLRDPIFIGCVDNNAARREIHQVTEWYESIWIDAGNESQAGQVIMGITGYTPGGYSWHRDRTVPSVVDIYPEILDPSKDPKTEISCAERAERDIQNIFVNLTAATHIMNFLNIIYNNKTFFVHGINFTIGGTSEPIFLEK